MPQLIKPSDVKVTTKDGEVKISISLDLNINLNQNTIDIETSGIDLAKKEEDQTIWQIPEFNSSEKIDFGK
jgi:hypothetical protein